MTSSDLPPRARCCCRATPGPASISTCRSRGYRSRWKRRGGGPAVLGGARLPVAQPEDLVIYKAAAWRPQDQQGVDRLLALHGARMDLARVRRHVQALGEAMEEDRIHALNTLILRVLGR